MKIVAKDIDVDIKPSKQYVLYRFFIVRGP